MKRDFAAVGQIAALCVIAGFAGAASPTPASNTSGIYTKGQSDRGAVVYSRHCAACHGVALTAGSAPPLTGPFWSSWDGRSMAELYQLIQGSMPQEAPSSLSDADYAAVIAHMLEVGGYPAGPAELPAVPDALAPLKIRPAR